MKCPTCSGHGDFSTGDPVLDGEARVAWLLVFLYSFYDDVRVDVLGVYTDEEDAQGALRVAEAERDAAAKSRRRNKPWAEGSFAVVTRPLNSDPDERWLAEAASRKDTIL